MRIDTLRQSIDHSERGKLEVGATGDAMVGMESLLTATITHNFASLVDGAGESVDVAVTGAALGDVVLGCSILIDLQEQILTGHVRAAGIVEVRLQNETAGTIDLASTTLRVVVLKLST